MPTDIQLSLSIRGERTADRDQVRRVNEAAFGRPDEADLVDRLRDDGAILLSMVAELDHQVIGHILFSRMAIEAAQGSVPAVSLAPMTVLPEHQGRGVGSQLVRRGLEQLRAQGERIVLVLGHKHYYPRFGFSSDKTRCLISPFPSDAYMALELADGALAGVHGTVRYSSAFGL